MGSMLSCCVSPNTNPTLGWRIHPTEIDYESEIYLAAARDMVAVASAPPAMEAAELDSGGGEGPLLQHISVKRMPKGKEVTYLRHTCGLCLPQGSLGGTHYLRLLPTWSYFSRAGHQG